MLDNKQKTFLSMLSKTDSIQAASNWNTDMDRFNGFNNADFWPILKDGKMFVPKAPFIEMLMIKLESFPYRDKTLEKVINDFKTLSKRNFYMMPFVEETDTFFVFEYSDGERLSPDNIQRALPQLKNYFQFNSNVENDLKLEYMGELFYDPLKNRIKLVDLSSLWYTPHIIDDDAVHKKYFDPGILFSQKDDNTVTIYSFLPDSIDTRQKIQKYIDIAESENHTCTVKYV